MASLNFKHLRYFWMVARSGSIARASTQLHVTPQSISGQLRELEDSIGVELFKRAGRNLEPTDAGRRILGYAEQIFALGDELLHVARDVGARRNEPFTIGIADSVPKMVAYRLVEPALRLAEPLRLICREGRLTPLLADLAVHRLDLVIADRPLPANLNVRGYSHFLGESNLAVLGAPDLLASLPQGFPALLQGAPFLMPGEDTAIRARLERWFEAGLLQPQVVGEFDDGALLKAFGQAGAGLFAVPGAIAEQVCALYGVREAGRIDTVVEQLYAITTERRLTHPAIIAIRDAARDEVFPAPLVATRGKKSGAAAARGKSRTAKAPAAVRR